MSDSDDKKPQRKQQRPRAVPERYIGPFSAQEHLHAEFADLVAEGHDVNSACAKMGLGASTVRAALNPNSKSYCPSFVALYSEAKQEFGEKLQVEAFRRAVTGNKRDIYFQGVVVGQETVYSDSLLLAMLKAYNPAFTERSIVQNINGNVDLNELAEMSAEQREKLEDLLRSMGPEGADDEA